MTFNIRGDYGDGENAWANRSGLNVDVIKKYSPDIIGFQELHSIHWETYETDLSEYERELGPKYDNEEPHGYCSIFWNPARFKAIDRGGFWLSETPEEFSASWNTACIRCANWVKLRAMDDDQVTILMLNTHLDHVSEQARIEGAKVITRRIDSIRDEGEGVVITGDFNTHPGSDAYRHFIEAGYIDTFTETGNTDGEAAFTYHGFKGIRTRWGRIDWILFSPGSTGIVPKETSIIRDAQLPLFPSDHFPIVAVFAAGS